MRPSDFDDDITLSAITLAEGERSEHQVCPFCRGGSSGERSMLVWADPGHLTYKCLRVSCGAFGKIGDESPRPCAKAKRGPKYRTNMLSPDRLQESELEFLYEKFPWLTERLLATAGIQIDDGTGGVLLPITTLEGRFEGWLARYYPELCNSHRGPKAKAFFEPWVEAPSGLMALPCHRYDSLVLVEDFWSGLRIHMSAPTCALSGTSLHPQALAAILRRGISNLVLILDADAIAKAAKMVADYRLMFKRIDFIPLAGADIKDMPDAEVIQLVEQIHRLLK